MIGIYQKRIHKLHGRFPREVLEPTLAQTEPPWPDVDRHVDQLVALGDDPDLLVKISGPLSGHYLLDVHAHAINL